MFKVSAYNSVLAAARIYVRNNLLVCLFTGKMCMPLTIGHTKSVIFVA